MSKELVLHSGTGFIARDPGDGVVHAYGWTVPSDGAVGYAPGCLFIQTDGATEATYWYVNVGTKASANFDAFDLNIAEVAFLSGVTAGTALASKALVLDSSGNVTMPLAGAILGLVTKSATAAAITTTRSLTAADSGGCFSVAKTSSYAITLPTPAQGIRFKFMAVDTGAFAVTLSNGSAHLFGVVDVAGTPVIMTGTTLSLAATGGIGDWVEIEGISATQYCVTGACVTAAKITMA